MSQRSFGEARSPSKTQKIEQQKRSSYEQSVLQRPQTERGMNHESPSKNQVDFYVRKVNRLENDLAALQDQLTITRVRLRKAEDFEIKYDLVFKENQKAQDQKYRLSQDNNQKKREIQDLLDRLGKVELEKKTIESHLNAAKYQADQLRDKNLLDRSKIENNGALQKAQIEEAFNRQIQIIKKQAKDRQDKLVFELRNAKTLNLSKDNVQASINYKLEKIKSDKNQEIDRLKSLVINLRTELTEVKNSCDSKLTGYRTSLIQETDSRIQHVRNLTAAIEESLLAEVENLNETIRKKDNEIINLIQFDRKSMQQHEEIQHGLKDHINRLQDKIFVLQRENELQLFKTIDRLKSQYDQTINELESDQDQVKQTYQRKVETLNQEISKLKQQNGLLDKQSKKNQEELKKLGLQKQMAVKSLSQKIIGLESLKDLDMKNYTTSMRYIQQQARAKLHDLHTTIANKNSEVQILNAQMSLKNEQVTHLINEINHLRDQNRQKISSIENTNASQQNLLNDLVTAYKKQVMELKRKVHQTDSKLNDTKKQLELENSLLQEDLTLQKEANEKLKARNAFLVQFSKELENNLKKQRISNVDVLHDHTVSRRETVQIRQQVRVELQAIMDKQLQKIGRNFKLQVNRLEADLNHKERELREKKEQLNRLMVEFKNLQKKIGKPSKLDKSSQEYGKCKATLDAQILLTENIYNAINRP